MVICIRNVVILYIFQSIVIEKFRKFNYMISISSFVEDVFGLAIRKVFFDVDNLFVMIQGSLKFVDYQCNSVMNIVKV